MRTEGLIKVPKDIGKNNSNQKPGQASKTILNAVRTPHLSWGLLIDAKILNATAVELLLPEPDKSGTYISLLI